MINSVPSVARKYVSRSRSSKCDETDSTSGSWKNYGNHSSVISKSKVATFIKRS